MSVVRTIAAIALAATLAACSEQGSSGYQGWVEADLIFVSPDEAGRVVRLSVREGDAILAGAPLYGLDDDLQKADLNQGNASLANAQQTFDLVWRLSSGDTSPLDRMRAGSLRSFTLFLVDLLANSQSGKSQSSSATGSAPAVTSETPVTPST